MKRAVTTTIVAVVNLWVAAMLIEGYLATSTPRTYDCSMAEFTPDITPQARAQCRQTRRKT